MNFSDLCYIDATGYHYPDYPTILAWLQSGYQGIYGADIYIEPDSQDGLFLAMLAQGFSDVATRGAAVYASFQPAGAQGVGLSRLVKLNGLKREVPSYSTVSVTIVGVAGTVITNGIVQDSLEQQWNLPTTVTIPTGGSITVSATAATIGQLFADIGTVTTIFTPTNGWQTVTNSVAAVPGQPVETDGELRVRQTNSTALPSLTVLEGTVGAVRNVIGVTQAVGYENDTDATDGNGLPPHSVCMVVAGSPASASVAQAIQIKKTPGTRTYGNVTTLVYDSEGMPLNISYQSAIAAEIKVVVNLVAGTGWSANYIPLIQAAVAAVVNALPIGGAQQSGVLYYTTLFPAAYIPGQPGETYDINSILIGKNTATPSAANIALAFDEIPVCSPTLDVTVNVS